MFLIISIVVRVLPPIENKLKVHMHSVTIAIDTQLNCNQALIVNDAPFFRGVVPICLYASSS
jgi:hypothetical protein